jgi:uncharacterized membrane protein
MKRWRRLVWLVGLAALIGLVHALAARALVDHGVAGALLAGGGGWGTVVGAAGFLLFRLASVVAVATVPAVLVWWFLPTRRDETRAQ